MKSLMALLVFAVFALAENCPPCLFPVEIEAELRANEMCEAWVEWAPTLSSTNWRPYLVVRVWTTNEPAAFYRVEFRRFTNGLAVTNESPSVRAVPQP